VQLGRDSQLKDRALHLRRELEARELMDHAVQLLADLGRLDQLPDLLAAQVVPPLPGQVLALHLRHSRSGFVSDLGSGLGQNEASPSATTMSPVAIQLVMLCGAGL